MSTVELPEPCVLRLLCTAVILLLHMMSYFSSVPTWWAFLFPSWIQSRGISNHKACCPLAADPWQHCGTPIILQHVHEASLLKFFFSAHFKAMLYFRQLHIYRHAGGVCPCRSDWHTLQCRNTHDSHAHTLLHGQFNAAVVAQRYKHRACGTPTGQPVSELCNIISKRSAAQ